MKRKMEQGVTMIALIVMVTVLIILAGVVIRFSVGDNGVVDKAKEAKTEVEKREATEEILVALNKVYAKSNIPTSPDGADLLKNNLKNELNVENQVDLTNVTIIDANNIQITYKGITITVDSELNIK